MSRLHFHDAAQAAAEHLIVNTSLNSHAFLHGRIDRDGPCGFTITVPENEHRWSNGETVLLDLLYALAGQASSFEIRDLGKLDEPSRFAAVWAIGLHSGVFTSFTRVGL